MASDVSDTVHRFARENAKRYILNNTIDNVLDKLKSDDPEKTSQDKVDDAIYAWNLGQKKLDAVDF